MEQGTKKRLTPGSIPLIISAIIGICYIVYLISYFGNANTTSASDSEAIGAGIATMLVMPHMICAGIALMFNVLAIIIKRSSGFALTAGILYTVSIALFFTYFMFVIVEAILCYVGYAKRKHAKKPQ